MRLLRRGPRLSGAAQARLAEHERRAGDVLERVRTEFLAPDGDAGRPRETPSAQELAQDNERALSTLVVSVASDDFITKIGPATSHDAVDGFVRNDLESLLGRRKLPYSREDVALLTAVAEWNGKASWRNLARCRVAVAALERYAGGGNVYDVAHEVKRLESVVSREHGSDWTSLAARLRRLSPEPAGVKLDRSLLAAKDPWTKKVRPAVERDYAAQGALLAHLASAIASSPTKKWLTEARSLLAGNSDGEALVRYLLEATFDVDSEELGRTVYDDREYVQMLWLTDRSATLVRGCLWASTLVDDDEWVVPVAAAIVDRSMREQDLKVANAALYALGESPREEAIALLSRLAARVKDRRFLKGIEKALGAAAAKRGLTPGQLRESLVPTFELAPDGTREVPIGDAVATIRVEPPGTVTTTWTSAEGREQKSVPTAIRDRHDQELRELKKTVAEIRKELGVQRLRLEGLLADERVWEHDDWRRYYLEHPLVQVFARRLIWRFDDVAAIPLEEGFVAADGSTVAPPESGEVRLWHPIHESADDVARWRQLIRERELVQPFKQAFREVYLVAPAELETASYSNRFAAHIVRYPQVYALTKQRGWSVVALGPYDNQGGRQWREFDEQGLRAEFWMDHADQDYDRMASLAELAATDQVRFYRGREQEPMPIAEVPAVVFSEAMRDVDLFVGVASIAADPEWLDHGLDRYHEYWRATSFGELGESAVVRREALAQLLPSLRIADRCSLTDRYLVVRGTLRTYRIHLGSGNILMEPNDEYLCIVPARANRLQKVYLPFPEDDRFSIILSKAFLLADDHKIADRSILAQIRRAS